MIRAEWDKLNSDEQFARMEELFDTLARLTYACEHYEVAKHLPSTFRTASIKEYIKKSKSVLERDDE